MPVKHKESRLHGEIAVKWLQSLFQIPWMLSSQYRLILCRNCHGSFRTRWNWVCWTLISAGKPLTTHCTHNFQASACKMQVIQRWPDNLASHTQLAGGPLEWHCFTHIESLDDLTEIKQDSQRNTEAIPHWEVMLEHNDEDRPTRCAVLSAFHNDWKCLVYTGIFLVVHTRRSGM